MSNTQQLMQQFAGFDQATVDGRNPRITEGHIYALMVDETFIHKGQQGESVMIEAKILASNDPTRPAETMVTHVINNIFSPTDYKRKGAWGQLKGFCSAMLSQHPMFNPQKLWIHPDTPPEQIGQGFSWSQFLALMVSNDRVAQFEPHRLCTGIPYYARLSKIDTKKIDPATNRPFQRQEYTFWAINDPIYAQQKV